MTARRVWRARWCSIAYASLSLAEPASAADQVAQAEPAAAKPAPALSPAIPSFAPKVVTDVSDHRLTIADLPRPRSFVTHHRTVIRGKPLNYTATAGETYITNLADEPIARFFAFSYIADGHDASRPVLFVFNGGPGSSSIWLHMGAIGPRRVVLDSEVNPSNTPPFGIRDNPFSVLDAADLVFIDPVGTGFSHAVGNAHDADFFSVDADADSVARFIEQWLTQNGRWNSPKYLMGESYGSIRAAVLPRALMGGPTYTGVMRGITVDGVILLGVALNVGTKQTPAPSNRPDPSVGLSLPSLAVTAWYHRRIDRGGLTAARFYDEVKQFGASDYADAVYRLNAGTLLEADEVRIAARLERYTSIPAAQWIDAKLRIPTNAFLKQVLASSGLEAGTYDSRYTLPLAQSGGEPVADDPAMGRYVPGFVASFHEMLRDDLAVNLPVPYSAITWEGLNFRWDYSRIGPPIGQNYADELATAMRRTPHLRVMVNAGYYDMLATPASTESQILHAKLPPDRVTIHNYESGHMLYLGETAEIFANDVRAFIIAGRAGSAHP